MLDELPGVRGLDRERLLAEHVRARLERGLRVLVVQAVRAPDEADVHAGVDHVAVVLARHAEAPVVLDLLEQLRAPCGRRRRTRRRPRAWRSSAGARRPPRIRRRSPRVAALPSRSSSARSGHVANSTSSSSTRLVTPPSSELGADAVPPGRERRCRRARSSRPGPAARRSRAPARARSRAPARRSRPALVHEHELALVDGARRRRRLGAPRRSATRGPGCEAGAPARAPARPRSTGRSGQPYSTNARRSASVSGRSRRAGRAPGSASSSAAASIWRSPNSADAVKRGLRP